MVIRKLGKVRNANSEVLNCLFEIVVLCDWIVLLLKFVIDDIKC